MFCIYWCFTVKPGEAFSLFKDFQSDQRQRSFRKIFTAHYASRNADLNLTLVMGMTYGFIFQIISIH